MSQKVGGYDLDLGEIRRRAYRAVTQDGLLELLLGIGFAAAAILVALDVYLNVTLFFLIGIPAVLLPLLLAPLRQRYTHTRIGYAELVSEENQRLIRGLLVVASLLGIGVLLVTVLALVFQQPYLPVVALFENLAVVLGLLFGAVFLYVAAYYGITRFYAFGLFSIAAAIATLIAERGILLLQDEPVARWLLYFALMAVILLPTGAVRFVRFLRDNPVIDEVGDNA